MAAAVSFLFYFAPGIQTAQFYAQQNDLHLTTQQQGTLVSLGGMFGVLAAFLYGAFAAKRFTLRNLLLACIVIGASSQAAYVFYYSYGVATLRRQLSRLRFHAGRSGDDAPGRARHAGGLRGAWASP